MEGGHLGSTQNTWGAFINYVDKKRWVGGQYKVTAWSCEQRLGNALYKNYIEVGGQN